MAIVGRTLPGRSLAEVERARDELRAMLKDGGPVPSAPFEGLEVLIPARDYKNRHASILLALEASCEAAALAEAAATLQGLNAALTDPSEVFMYAFTELFVFGCGAAVGMLFAAMAGHGHRGHHAH